MSVRRRLFTYETGVGVISGLTIAFLVVFLIRMLSPYLVSIAREELQSMFNKICNEAVLEYFENEAETDLFRIERQANGELQGIITDTKSMNRLKSSLNLKIQSELDKIDEIRVGIPLFGERFKISVHLMGVTALETDYVSEFESVGINQTKISVDTVISASGNLLAIGRKNPVTVKTSVPVLMTVVVGKVPGTYVEVNREGKK